MPQTFSSSSIFSSSLTRDIWQLWIFESTASLRVGRKIKHTCMIQTLKSYLYLMDQDPSPFPLPHLIFFPTYSLDFKGKKILLPISLFSTLNSWYDLLLFQTWYSSPTKLFYSSFLFLRSKCSLCKSFAVILNILPILCFQIFQITQRSGNGPID